MKWFLWVARHLLFLRIKLYWNQFFHSHLIVVLSKLVNLSSTAFRDSESTVFHCTWSIRIIFEFFLRTHIVSPSQSTSAVLKWYVSILWGAKCCLSWQDCSAYKSQSYTTPVTKIVWWKKCLTRFAILMKRRTLTLESRQVRERRSLLTWWFFLKCF